jgi:hypothetical protein
VTYLTQSIMADDPYLRLRVSSCAAQQGCAEDFGIDSDGWTMEWRRVWAASPGWDAAWESARAATPPVVDPGADPGVITDAQVLSQVQSMMPFTRVADHAPQAAPAEARTGG